MNRFLGDGSLTGANLLSTEWPQFLADLAADGVLPADIVANHPTLHIAGIVGSIDGEKDALQAIIDGKVDVIDTLAGKVVHAFEPGKGILHMEFAPRGENVWLSARDDNKVLIYNTENFAKLGEIPAESPSGIFFTSRAVRIGF